MKTLTAILFVVVCVIIPLNASDDLGYLITATDTFICKDIKNGIIKMRLTLPNGEKQKIEKDDVKTFYVHGKRYDRLPVYINGIATGEVKFLELLSQRNGLKLYKHTFFCCGYWNMTKQKIESAGEKNVLLVYKDDNYYLQLDNRNAESLASFFHIGNLTLE